MRALLPRLARKAGVHAHGLRHSHAAELAAEGFPVNLVQAQLGHASLAWRKLCLHEVHGEPFGSDDPLYKEGVDERQLGLSNRAAGAMGGGRERRPDMPPLIQPQYSHAENPGLNRAV